MIGKSFGLKLIDSTPAQCFNHCAGAPPAGLRPRASRCEETVAAFPHQFATCLGRPLVWRDLGWTPAREIRCRRWAACSLPREVGCAPGYLAGTVSQSASRRAVRKPGREERDAHAITHLAWRPDRLDARRICSRIVGCRSAF